MKKAILLVAVAIVAALLLTACNKEDDRPQQPSTFTATEQYNDTIIIRYVSEDVDLVAHIEKNRTYRKWCRETEMEGVLAFMNYHVWAYIEEHPEVLTMFCVDGVVEVDVYSYISGVAFVFLPQDFPRHYCFFVE